jgi:hypothetical protein
MARLKENEDRRTAGVTLLRPHKRAEFQAVGSCGILVNEHVSEATLLAAVSR